MKTNKTFAYGLFAVILVLSLTGCPDPDPTHTHDYGTAWKSNATQHWHECSCGEKADVANHTGDPCAICGYASGSQNPDLCECNGKAEDCECDDCDCATCTFTANVNVAAVPFTAGTELKFNIDGGAGNNYSFVGGTADGFTTDDLNGITYTLSSVNPVKDLSAYSNGNVPSSVYATNDYPTITQTFYYGGQAVGQRRVVVLLAPSGFQELYEYKPTEFDGEWFDTDFVDIHAIPATTLNISKEISANTPTSAHAQAAPTHTLANNLSITLNGTGSAGNITAYAWECVSYTADQGTVSAVYSKAQVDALITNANTATATVAPRKAGTYVFRLTVTDNEGESDTDTVAVVVGAGTITKDVNVTFEPFGTNPTSISMVPIYTPTGGWGDYFSEIDILNKITFSFQTDNHATVYDYPDNAVTIAKQSELNEGPVPWPCPLYKQTFYYKEVKEENKLGRYEVFIGDAGGNDYFNQIRANDNATNPGRFNTSNTLVTSLPPTPLILQLSRTVTELP